MFRIQDKIVAYVSAKLQGHPWRVYRDGILLQTEVQVGDKSIVILDEERGWRDKIEEMI